jgi:hypothetical protein
VQHAAAGGHPLNVACLEDSVRAGMVAMLELAFEHHRDRLHAAVRMLLEPAGPAEPVFAQEKKRRRGVVALGADDELLFLHLRGCAARDHARDPADRFLRRFSQA